MATPLAAYSLKIRARLRNHPGNLGQLISALGAAGGSLMAIEVVAADAATITRDLVVFCPSAAHAADLAIAAHHVEGTEILAVEDRTFATHQHGKLSIE